VESRLERDGRLIVPVGECDQHGPHLPIGASGIVVDILANEISAEFGVLRAPLLPFGVNLRTRRDYPGAATLREKTLHRVLNELLASWEDQGFDEFILLTAHGHDAHLEALATVRVREARIRVLDLFAIDLSQFLEGNTGPQHGGEILTSLLLHLRPELVRMEAAADYLLEGDAVGPFGRGRFPTLPSGCRGAVGQPTLASAEKGREIYTHIRSKVRQKVFLSPPDERAAG